MRDLNRLLDQAIALHQGGDPIAAEGFYRQILVAAPTLADVHYLLGMACLQQGKADKAVRSLRTALAQKPERLDWQFNLGVAQRQAGALAAAVDSFAAVATRQAVGSPEKAAALAEQGAVLLALGDLTAAEAALRQALAAGAPDAARNLATCLYNLAVDPAAPGSLARLEEAATLFPSRVEIRERLGLALLRADRAADAAAQFRLVLAQNPAEQESRLGLCDALSALGLFDEAVAEARSLLAQHPGGPAGLVALASGLHGQGQLSAAAAALEQALLASPQSFAALVNLGTVKRDQGDDAGAEACYRAALALCPDDPIAHWQRAQARLLAGDMAEGWREYEWRWQVPGFPLAPALAALPLWDGGALPAGRRLLVHVEQGHGDTLQFLRYVWPLVARGVPVLCQVQPALRRLCLESLPPVVEIGVLGEAVPADIACRIPLLSLPLRLGDGQGALGHPTPYLQVPGERRNLWAQRLAALPGLKVGLVWAGDARAGDPRAAATDRRRSLSLTQLAALGSLPGISFVSLQKGPRSADAHVPDTPIILTDWTSELADFADTAALVQGLDLVIGVDTAVIHLAGGLGVPVWVLSRFDGCWRWLRNRNDSPWYPTLRLFRQSAWGDWGPVLIELTESLARFIDQRIGP
ncbi:MULTISPECIES: tetratricopeptide repeat protein [unclassified Azospirillum]|uniref:tetratricopeptide repeat protein n=1 Tax=unclassified Azospirillum TaxID=2630922 RepID=UPI000B6EDB27|nr:MULTISPECIES: tetratricopeptide repeat protein [unclassified Azospirillum]SNS78250.1 Tfp pilus assembly protein PilF [Azospirillum sp. RU38E]SNS95516.1 Tfp pilus assembly protein PilF [Azospirillum sp. RU37A]